MERSYPYHDGGTTITVPEGFTFDLASVPRPLWPLIAPFELSIAAPLLHDLIYRYGGRTEPWTDPPRRYTRREADAMFSRVMDLEGVPRWRRRAAWAAVRVFGRGAWRG